MKKIDLLMICGFLVLSLSGCRNNESFDNNPSNTSSSETEISEEKRPVWLLGHHCNSNYRNNSGNINLLEDRDIYKALASGCNGVEIDLQYRKSDKEIVLCHLGENVNSAETLNEFLSLEDMKDSRLSMVVYDIKDYEFLNQIVKITHDFYKNDYLNQKVHFVYSISELSKLKVGSDPYFRFREVAPILWPNEALEIDYENDADAVQTMFNDIEFTRGVFGNGIFSGQARGNIENSCKKAISIKNNETTNPYRFKAVESWTVNRLDSKNGLLLDNVGLLERIQWGCDIVLLDGFKKLSANTFNTFYACDLFKENLSVKLAEISDYPFGSLNF